MRPGVPRTISSTSVWLAFVVDCPYCQGRMTSRRAQFGAYGANRGAFAGPIVCRGRADRRFGFVLRQHHAATQTGVSCYGDAVGAGEVIVLPVGVAVEPHPSAGRVDVRGTLALGLGPPGSGGPRTTRRRATRHPGCLREERRW